MIFSVARSGVSIHCLPLGGRAVEAVVESTSLPKVEMEFV